MNADNENSRPELQPLTAAIVICAVVLMVVLRIAVLDSDPYSRLSWSSGLLTDEGYYIHNARNLVLFGVARTDDFNNMLIMPTLHFVQVAVFRQWGAGVVPARMISVICSLLGVMVLFAAARRAFGATVACYAALFVGLDHINLLYNRMALMDTPGEMVLIFAFYAWVRDDSGERGERAGRWWLAACGALLALAFVTRGLAAFVLPVPFVAIWLTRRGSSRAACLSIAYGLGAVLLLYVLLWYLPNRAELAHVNRHYLWHQLLPNDASKLALNFGNAWFGDERGAAPFLMRHSPIVMSLVVGWIVFLWRHRVVAAAQWPGFAHANGDDWRSTVFAMVWLAFAALFLSITNYSPSRYYLLFYPAMGLIAALALANAKVVLLSMLESPILLFLFGSYAAYHAALLGWHHGTATAVAAVGAMALLGGGLSLGIGTLLRAHAGRAAVAGRTAAFLLLCWTGVNGYYLADWLTHLSYEQRDASLWLAANLPADSVLLGDVAPGVCLYNRFKAISVIPGLCNDRKPVESFEGFARAIAILDEPVKERWWTDHYPEMTGSESRMKLFPHIVRFPVGVYRVQAKQVGRRR